MKTSRQILYECIRLLMTQVREEQSSRQALIRALMVEDAKPVQIPTNKEVHARIKQLSEILKNRLTTKPKNVKI